MRKKYQSFYYITLTIICQLLTLFPASAYAQNVEDFYFDSFEADYYLSADSETGSRLKVVEKLTAIFPDHPQNKGICREIPFLNRGGKNRTLQKLDRSNIKVLRNGVDEPIYSIEKKPRHYSVCTGTEDYLTGPQTFTLSYEFTRVVSAFSDSQASWQELYWNTNGTGWRQHFNRLTARVHLEKPDLWTQKSSCYVGHHGEKGQDRCQTTLLEDGVAFTAQNLTAGENLSFDLEFKSDSFTIPSPKQTFIMFFILPVVFILAGLWLAKPLKKYRATASKRKFHHDYFIKPEYQPHPDYDLPELSATYLGPKKDLRVALLLQMVIAGKIQLIKGEKSLVGGQKWRLRVKNSARLSEAESLILKILNGAEDVSDGTIIDLKSQTATSTLADLSRRFDGLSAQRAKSAGLFETTSLAPSTSLIALLILFTATPIVLALFDDVIPALPARPFHEPAFNNSGAIVVAFAPILAIIIGTIALSIISSFYLERKTRPFLLRTQKGLELSRYLDGLKLYIGMAEADRLKFLHSAQGADTSPGGIVKLYEKLLPFAALFGLETSWLKELEKYYQLEEVETPDWYRAGSFASMTELSHALGAVSSCASSSRFTSSSSSGGGGGGFSGGGGGGGGGGGR